MNLFNTQDPLAWMEQQAEYERQRAVGIEPAPPEPAEPYVPEALPPEPEPNPYREIARPLTEEIIAARQKADQLRNEAQISRGGSKIAAAIAGTKPTFDTAEALEAQAALPEKRVAQDVQLGEVARRLKAEQEPLDPNSRSSRAAQDVLLSTAFGRTLGVDKVRSMSQRDIEKATGVLKDDATVGLGKQRYDADQGFRDRTQDEVERHNKAMENRPTGLGGGLASNEYQNRIDRRRDNADAVSLGTKTGKHSEVVQSLRNIERHLPGMTSGVIDPKKISVVDKLALLAPGGFGEQFASNEAVLFQTVLKDFQDLIQRSRSGAVLNEGEEKHYTELFRNQLFSDPKNAANTLREMKALIHSKMRDLAAGYPEHVVEQYRARGGTTYQDPLFRELNGEPAAAPPLPTEAAVREPGKPFTKDGKVLIIRRADGVPMWASPESATKALGSKKYREVENQVEFDALSKALGGGR